MDITFLESGPAIQMEEEKRILVLADLHMGIESDLRLHGIHLQSRAKERINRLTNLIKDSSPDIVLMLGDIKHRVPGTSWQEFREIPELLNTVRNYADLMITPGNHDPGIQEFMKKGELLGTNGVLLDGIGYLHGHTTPDPVLAGHLIIAGHHHPSIHLYDEVGIALRTPCYLLAELKMDLFRDTTDPDGEKSSRLLLIPAFNEFTGYGIEKTLKSPFSPLSRSIQVETAECLLPDGTYAGDVPTLIKHATDKSP